MQNKISTNLEDDLLIFDESNIDHMINENSYIVEQIAARYADSDIPSAKLIQRGYEELVNSARRFDANAGFSFKVYASWLIKSALAEMVAQGETPSEVHKP